MANTIALAQKYINDPANFNQVYKAAAKSADLEANEIKFLDGNVVKLPKYSFSVSAMGTYDRATGAPVADLTETWSTYQLSQDKGNSLFLDVMDDEETLSEGLIKRANEYVRQIAVPTVDAYRFGVLGTVPTPAATPTVLGSKIVTSAASTTATILTNVDAAFQYLEEKEVSVEGLILYVTPAVRNLMNNATGITKYFSVQQMHDGDVSTKVEFYNGAKIVVVASSRLGTKVEFILVQPKCVGSTVKFNESRLIDLTATDDKRFGFAWKYRMYYDLFLAAGPAIIEGTTPNFTLVNPGVYVKKES